MYLHFVLWFHWTDIQTLKKARLEHNHSQPLIKWKLLLDNQRCLCLYQTYTCHKLFHKKGQDIIGYGRKEVMTPTDVTSIYSTEYVAFNTYFASFHLQISIPFLCFSLSHTHTHAHTPSLSMSLQHPPSSPHHPSLSLSLSLLFLYPPLVWSSAFCLLCLVTERPDGFWSSLCGLQRETQSVYG